MSRSCLLVFTLFLGLFCFVDAKPAGKADESLADAVTWAKANAIVLSTEQAGNGFSDLLPLREKLVMRVWLPSASLRTAREKCFR